MKSAWLLGLPAARSVAAAIAFFASVLTARVLGPVEFGYLSAGIAVATVAAVLGSWGVDQLQIFHGLDEDSARWATRIVAGITVLGGCALAAGWPSLSYRSRWCALVAVVVLAARILLAPWLTSALKELDIAIRIRRELGTLTVSSIAGLLAAEATGDAVASLLATAGVLLGVACITGRRPQPRQPHPRFRHVVRRGMPYALSSAAYTLYFAVDAAMLASIRGEHEVGQYRAAYLFFAAVLLVPVAINNDLLRANLARARSGSSFWKTIRQYGMITFILGMFGFVFLLVGHEWLIRVFYGSSYESAAPMLGILAFAVGPNYLNSWLANSVISNKKVRSVATVQGVLTVLNISANLIVIPSHGAVGAAWVTVATELIALPVYAVLLSRTVWSCDPVEPGLAGGDVDVTPVAG